MAAPSVIAAIPSHGIVDAAVEKTETLPPSLMPGRCLQHVLRSVAESRPSRGIIFYPPGNTSTPVEITYSSLLDQATRASRIVRSLPGFQAGKPILLRLDDQWDTILWVWAILLAGGVPVPSPPFGSVAEQRSEYVAHLSKLLESPICITRAGSVALFGSAHGLRLHTIETLLLLLDQAADAPLPASSAATPSAAAAADDDDDDDDEGVAGHDTALLMMTSGSTGDAKAARLSHAQILAASAGKASVRRLPPNRPLLNWIGLDHVCSLVEIHFNAMHLGVDQVLVHASDMIASPTTFLDLLSRHDVSRSFAPNFFLAKLVTAAERFAAQADTRSRWDLRGLVMLATGGEANDTRLCRAAAALLARHGAPATVLTPTFGMTETCAGAIFNLDFPGDEDTEGKREFASVGKCMRDFEMRVTVPTPNGPPALASAGQPGDLEVRGQAVFDAYYRNPEATADAFTPDAWFRTGDRATIDLHGRLDLLGRVKDFININSIKTDCAGIQAHLSRTVGARVKRLVSFPARAPGVPTEHVTVVFVPKESPMSAQAAVHVTNSIVEACLLYTGSTPVVFSVEDESLVPTTTLGKTSRAKMRMLFESGVFAHSQDQYSLLVRSLKTDNLDHPATKAETLLVREYAAMLDIAPELIGVNTPIFEMGLTSMDLIRLKNRIDDRLGVAVPVVLLITNPTARSLARTLEELRTAASLSEAEAADPAAYDPVVPLRSGGSKTPLWLIHPGVGEVLVFVGLAQQLAHEDRPVYALRARGFEPGQRSFDSIAETVDAYLAAICRRQPEGPYAIAGYSYASMLAFEVAKRLEAERGAVVPFLGSLNLPPHIKPRMRQLAWSLCLLHLSHFLDLVSESRAEELEGPFAQLTRDEAITEIMCIAHAPRMAELGLDEAKLVRWANVAFGLQSMAVNYEPGGNVGAMDIFHAVPLKAAAKSRQDWLDNHLSRWADFVRTEPRFHEVGGEHYTMIGATHVASFARTLETVLRHRGV